MQFLHVDDMADALAAAFEQNKPGVYNVAPDDYVTYQVAVEQSGCRKLPVPSIPPLLPKLISGVLNWNSFFPPYLINRSEERRVGKECCSQCKSRCPPHI